MKKVLFTTLLFIASPLSQALTPLNMAYVEVNDHPLTAAGCYLRNDNGQPLFNFVSVFAANINGNNPNQPHIYLNPQVAHLLKETTQVQQLQAKGIKVLLTLLGNHQNAGWSCMTNQHAIDQFATAAVKLMKHYQLDGIDIDDEYSTCSPNSTSLLRIAKAIKAQPDFKGKYLTKALFADYPYFDTVYEGKRLSDYLDKAWEMSYGYPAYDYRLNPYMQAGIARENLFLGEATKNDPHDALNATQYILTQAHGGMMFYNVRTNLLTYFNAIAQAEYGAGVHLAADCIA
jgi:hypothetical protein